MTAFDYPPAMATVDRVFRSIEDHIVRVGRNVGVDNATIERRAQPTDPATLTRHKAAVERQVACSDTRIDECIEVPQFGVGRHRPEYRRSRIDVTAAMR